MVRKKGTQQKRKKSLSSPDTVSDFPTRPVKRHNTNVMNMSGMNGMQTPTTNNAPCVMLQQQPQQYYVQGSPSYQPIPMPVLQSPVQCSVNIPVHQYDTPQAAVQSHHPTQPALLEQPNQSSMQSTLDMLLQKINIIDSKLSKLDNIEKCVENMKTKINSVENRVTNLEGNLTESNKILADIESSRAFDSQCCDDLQQSKKNVQDNFNDEKHKQSKLIDDIKILRAENARLSEESLDMQARSMRDNLLFVNLAECPTFDERKEENCVETIRTFCSESLKIDADEINKIRIDRAHRVGRYNDRKIRPVVVKFNYYPDKLKVKQAAYTELKNSTYRVADQYPREIRERRQTLYPIMLKAREMQKQVVMSYDR